MRVQSKPKARLDISIEEVEEDERLQQLPKIALMEQNDEWAVQRARYMTLETIAPISDNPIVILSAVTG